jgi:hypothetical protein
MLMHRVGTEDLALWFPPVEKALPLPAAPAETSQAAAKAFGSKAGTARAIVYRAILEHRGLACFQIEAITDLDGNTVRPRLRELEQLAMIHKSPTRTALTAAGLAAAVYEVGPPPSPCP